MKILTFTKHHILCINGSITDIKRRVWNCIVDATYDSDPVVRGVARNLLRGGQNRGSGRRKSPSGVQGQNPGRGLGAKPPEAGDIYRMHNKENKQKYTTALYIF